SPANFLASSGQQLPPPHHATSTDLRHHRSIFTRSTIPALQPLSSSITIIHHVNITTTSPSSPPHNRAFGFVLSGQGCVGSGYSTIGSVWFNITTARACLFMWLTPRVGFGSAPLGCVGFMTAATLDKKGVDLQMGKDPARHLTFYGK
nr:hypothetical protein [Tanacetum cinerariifolium]